MLVKSTNILWKSEDLRGFQGRILQIIKRTHIHNTGKHIQTTDYQANSHNKLYIYVLQSMVLASALADT